jgi:hypothetical protein
MRTGEGALMGAVSFNGWEEPRVHAAESLVQSERSGTRFAGSLASAAPISSSESPIH